MPKRKSSAQSDLEQKKAKLETTPASIDQSNQNDSLLVKIKSLLNELMMAHILRNEKTIKSLLNKIEINLKDIIKIDKKTDFSSLFKSFLTVLLQKSFDSDSNEFERLLTYLNQFKIDSLVETDLCESVDLVVDHVKTTSHPLPEKIEVVLSTICKHLIKIGNASKVTNMFKTILKDHKSNQAILVQLLAILNGLRQEQHKNLALTIIKEIFSIPIKKFRLSATMLERLVHNLLTACSVFTLSDHYSYIYEQILSIVLEKRTKIDSDEKSTLIKLEKSTIQMLVNHLAATKNTIISQAYFVAFKSALNQTLLNNQILDKFILCLYFSTFNILSSKSLCEQFSDHFIEFVKNLLDIGNEIITSEWLQNCTIKNYNSLQLNRVFNSRLLCHVITPETLTNGLFNLSKSLVNKYIDSNENDSLLIFVNQIIEEIFSIQLQNKAKIIEDYLNICFKSSNRSFFINLLEKLLVKESVRKVFNENLTEIDKAKVQLALVHRLIGSSSNESILFIESTNHAVNLFNALQPLVFDLKIEHVKELVDYFETNLKNVSTEKASAYCLISLIKSLNTKGNQRSAKDENKLEQNYQYSIRILDQFKEILRKTIDPDLKSQIYQSFYYLIKSNSKLIQPVSTLLLKQIKKYVILPNMEKSKQAFFDLSKCFVLGQTIQLIEPIDILFHSMCVCVDRMCKPNQASSQKNISELKKIIDLILNTYAENGKSNQINLLYTKQISSVSNHVQSLELFKMVHQIKLGLIDCLVEYSTSNYLFTELTKLIDVFVATQNLNSLDLENLMSGKQSPTPSVSVKRKLFNENSVAIKKVKLNDENKENKSTGQVKKAQRSRTTKREPLVEITNEPNSVRQSVQQPTEQINKLPMAFASIQLNNYEPRLSLDCILKLISLTQITSTNQYLIDIKLTLNETIRGKLIGLITNSAFNEYIIKIIESKLKIFTENKPDNSFYDIHSINNKELFDMLSTIWKNFYQRIVIQNISSKSDKFSFKPALPTQFNQNFLVKYHRCLNICVDIWKIVNKHFPNKLINLISFKSKTVFSSEHQELAWQFLLDCTNKIELLTKSSEASSLVISKCCSILLNMANDLIDKINLSLDKISNFYAWLCRLAKKNIAGEMDTTNMILELMIKISNRKFSSSVTIKHLLLEYYNFMYIQNPHNEIDNPIEYGNEFKLLNTRSSSVYLKCVINELTRCIKQIKWSIMFNNYFNQTKLINLVMNNLESIIIAVDFLIQSTTDWNSVNLTLISLDQLYQFMHFFLNDKIINQFNDNEKLKLKSLIELVYSSLENNIETKLNNLNESLWISESNEKKIESNNDLTKVLEYKQLMNGLIDKINIFERNSCDLFAKYRNTNVIKEFKPFISEINLSLDNRITKTVTTNQLNELINK